MNKDLKKCLRDYQLAKANFTAEKQKVINEVLKVLIIDTQNMDPNESKRYVHHFIEINSELIELRTDVQIYYEEYLTYKSN